MSLGWLAPAILIVIGALNFFSARKRGATWFSIGAAGIVLCGALGVVVTFWRSMPVIGILAVVLLLSVAATVTGFLRNEFKPLT
ncbi:MAG: hypothetical protein ACXWNJ_11195 [Vulcanimicrobiaceae bacterium]